MAGEDSNPFATRYTRPGAIPYLFPEAVTAVELLRKLESHAWWGQIVGPHGTGKSTLLHTLSTEMTAHGRRVIWFSQHAGQRRLDASAAAVATWNASTQVVVDGYEQLGWLARARLKRACRAQQAGLLVTAHTDVGLPTLWNTAADEATTRQVVEYLLSCCHGAGISQEDVSRCYQQHDGNVRETLFALFDLYELRQRSQS